MSDRKHKVLLLGYGGANNTGSDVRLITIIEDIRRCYGNSATITVCTVNREKTLRSIPEQSGLSVVRFPYVFPFHIYRLVAAHDVLFLVEGSTFKQNWSNALLYLFLWAAWCAKALNKKCVAYAVDVGILSGFNRRLTTVICNNLDLIITRTTVAKTRLLDMGIRQNIFVTTDTAFAYTNTTEHLAARQRTKRTLAVAPIEFYQWPVKVKLFGKQSECYHWPYYYSWDEGKRRQSRFMQTAFGKLIAHGIDMHDLNITLIAMEQLDRVVCEKILGALDERYRHRVTCSYAGECDLGDIVRTVRGADYLVTARYHACVLSMATAVAQIAIAHDERLESIYAEMDMDRYCLSHLDPRLPDLLIEKFDDLVTEANTVSSHIKQKHDHYFLPKCYRNRDVLETWITQTVGRVV